MTRHTASTTNLLSTCAAVFGCVSGKRNGLPQAQRPSSNAIRYEWDDVSEDQVHPGEGAT